MVPIGRHMEEYRVNLDIYNGPLDLLLYLIRRDEVDIYDIPVASLTEQYLKYVDVLHQLDPNMAGEFLVMAATLLEIKTRMLLPVQQNAQEGVESEGDLAIDPRAELVRQLLEYKRFKDAAGDLRDVGEEQSMRHPRRPVLPDARQTELDLEDVQVWDLLEAFSKLMESIGQRPSQHQVIYDDTPVELHAEDIMDRLSREGSLTFRRIFEGRTRRTELVGLFIAVLELVRLKKIVALQESNFGEINIRLKPEEDTSPTAESQEEPSVNEPPAPIESSEQPAEHEHEL
jgi:segregation and condensation protein A